MKAPSPLLGFNNNVKHKGRVFHIQTEDSGIKHPHVITHLFVDGGRILKSIKTSYAEFLEDEQMAVKVRQLMQEQHKAMFIALRAGKFDHLMEGDGAPPSSSEAAKIPAPPASQAGPVEAGPKVDSARTGQAMPAEATSSEGSPRSDAKSKSEAAPTEAATPKDLAESREARGPRDSKEEAPISAQPSSQAFPPRPGSQTSAAKARPPTPPPSRTDRNSAPPNLVSLRPPSLLPPPPRAPSPSMASIQAFTGGAIGDRRTDPRAETEQAMPATEPRQRVNSPALELNLEALERASVERTQGTTSSSDLRDLPPPPAAVLGKKPASIDTSYRSIAPPGSSAHVGSHRASEPNAQARTPVPPSATPNGPSSLNSGPPLRPRTQPFTGLSRPSTGANERRSVTPQGARYAPSRPASIFGSARPQEGSSIFGEDLISEKSLDEVILGYLAEDLEGAKPKK